MKLEHLSVLLYSFSLLEGRRAEQGDILVVEGETIELKCNRTVNEAVDWRFMRDPTEFSLYICIGGRLLPEHKPKFEMNVNDYTLTVHDINTRDAGSYLCIEDSGIGRTHVTTLYVKRRERLYAPTTNVDINVARSHTHDDLGVESMMLIASMSLSALTIIILAVAGLCLAIWWRRRNRRNVLCPELDVDIANPTLDNMATGATHLGNKLFVIMMLCNKIVAFDQSGKRLPNSDIEVAGLYAPRDIVACRDRKLMFVLDLGEFGKGCIWQVSLGGEVRKFLPISPPPEPFAPYTLSIRSQRLLVTLRHDGLLLTGRHGEEIVILHRPEMKIQHAVETSRDTFVVCHLHRLARIVEMDRRGQILSVYNDKRYLHWPRYLSLDSDDNIVVAEFAKDYVLLLDSTFSLKCIVLSRKRNGLAERPWRMQFTEHQGKQLTICSGDDSNYCVQRFNIHASSLEDVTNDDSANHVVQHV